MSIRLDQYTMAMYRDHALNQQVMQWKCALFSIVVYETVVAQVKLSAAA